MFKKTLTAALIATTSLTAVPAVAAPIDFSSYSERNQAWFDKKQAKYMTLRSAAVAQYDAEKGGTWHKVKLDGKTYYWAFATEYNRNVRGFWGAEFLAEGQPLYYVDSNWHDLEHIAYFNGFSSTEAFFMDVVLNADDEGLEKLGVTREQVASLLAGSDQSALAEVIINSVGAISKVIESEPTDWNLVLRSRMMNMMDSLSPQDRLAITLGRPASGSGAFNAYDYEGFTQEAIDNVFRGMPSWMIPEDINAWVQGAGSVYITSGDAAIFNGVVHYIEAHASSVVKQKLDTLRADVDTLRTDLTQEIADRIADVNAEEARAMAAEAALTNALAQEVMDRIADVNAEEARAIAAEAVIQADVDQNELDSDAADAALQTALTQEIADRIADVNAEEAARIAADAVLTTNLAQEVADRIADVNAEEARALAAEAVLTAGLAQEVMDRTAADTSIRDDFAAADAALQATLTQEVNDRIAAVADLRADLNTEIADRMAAVAAERQARIDAMAIERTRVDGVIAALQADVDQNEADADAALAAAATARAALQTAINNEVAARNTAIAAERTAREAAEMAAATARSAIQADVDQNEADADAAIASLRADLNAEIAATDGDVTRLEGLIAAETTARTTALAAEQARVNTLIATLQADVDMNEADADAAIAALQSALNAEIAATNSDVNALSNRISGVVERISFNNVEDGESLTVVTEGGVVTTVSLTHFQSALDVQSAVNNAVGGLSVDSSANSDGMGASWVYDASRRLWLDTDESVGPFTTAQMVANGWTIQRSGVLGEVDRVEQALNAEISATNADVTRIEGLISTLRADLNDEISATNSDITRLENLISAETTARTTAAAAEATRVDGLISALQADVNANEADADAAIASLRADLNAEISATNADITRLEGLVSAETTARTQAIAAEVTARTNAINTINTEIGDPTDAASATGSLYARLAEVVRQNNAEHSSVLTTLGNVNSAISSLTTRVSTLENAVDAVVTGASFDASTGLVTLTLSEGAAVTVDISSVDTTVADTNDYVTGASVNAANDLVITRSGSLSDIVVPLDAFLDNTDSQTISLSGNMLSISGGTGAGYAVDLSGYLDNTDSQSLSLSGNVLGISGHSGTVDLSAYLDNTNDYVDALSLSGNTLTVGRTGSLTDLTVDLSGFMDNTDDQTLTLTGNTLSISGPSGSSVDLSGFMDDTDDQQLSISGNVISLTDGGSITLPSFDASTITAMDIANWNAAYTNAQANSNALVVGASLSGTVLTIDRAVSSDLTVDFSSLVSGFQSATDVTNAIAAAVADGGAIDTAIDSAITAAIADGGVIDNAIDAALADYRTSADQDTIDNAQNTRLDAIESRLTAGGL